MKAYSAASFVDSIGFNVHLGYPGTAYANFGVVDRLLVGLDIHHIRTGLPRNPTPQFYQEVKTLASQGIKTDLIVGSPDAPKGGTLTPVAEEIARINDNQVGPSLDSVEGPNEWDGRGGSHWVSSDRSYQMKLYAAMKADTADRGIPVVGPSVANPKHKAALGDLSAYLDYGNNHSYPRGQDPVSNLSSALQGARVVSGSKPVMATETGYDTATAGNDQQPPVSSSVQSVYLPWLFTSYFDAGVYRTYDYELMDDHPDPSQAVQEDHFGVAESNGTPKPAYTALANLMKIIGPTTPSAPGATSRLPVASLTVRLSPSAARLPHLLLQQADGSYLLLLWQPQELPATSGDGLADGSSTMVSLTASGYAATTYRPTLSSGPLHDFEQSSVVQGSLGPDLTAIQLTHSSATGTGVVPRSGAAAIDAFGSARAPTRSTAHKGSSRALIAALIGALVVVLILIATVVLRRRGAPSIRGRREY